MVSMPFNLSPCGVCMIDTLSFAHSPCPNDTFIFHALNAGLVPGPCLDMDVRLADIEELNSIAAHELADVVKVSVAAVAGLLDRYVVLTAGGALGRGVGPVLVSGSGCTVPDLDGQPVAIPGFHTTANLLFGLFCKQQGIAPELTELVYDQVMPGVSNGRVRAGVVIHEGRFTFAAHGLQKLMDLGQWWEQYTGLPLPLGCIMVRRSLGMGVARAVDRAIRASLEYAWANPDASREYVREHAQEMQDEVIDRHIRTFVTDYSLDVGAEGEGAIMALLEEACRMDGNSLPDLPIFVPGK